jgi:acyl-coenzyme A thioesterase PaaI-like protein
MGTRAMPAQKGRAQMAGAADVAPPRRRSDDAAMGTGEGEQSLQERYAPKNRCFGCGPANDKGLRIRSLVRGEEVVCTWSPEPHHQAFLDVLNGGICGALLDCHSNWTAIHHIMQTRGLDKAPAMVTADFHVRLKKPTPLGKPVELRARAVETSGDRVVVESTLLSGGVVTATCRGTFVVVKEGHPAYHRW